MNDKKLYSKTALHHTYTAIQVVPAAVGDVQAITGLPPVIAPGMRVKSVSVDLGLAEVTQILYVSLAAAVVADTRYGLKLKWTDEFYEKQTAEPQSIMYTSPTALTGTATIDRHNLYTSLAHKFNALQRFSRWGVAYAVFTTPSQTNVAAFTPGNILVQTATGARALILSGTTGAFVLAAIPGYSSTTFNTTACTEETTAGVAGTGSCSAIGAAVFGVRLEIRDRAGYYPINSFRGGKLQVAGYTTFLSTDITVNTAAVYAKYSGAQILQQVPVKEFSSENLATGYIDHANMNNVAVSGTLYNLVTIQVEEDVNASQLAEAGGVTGKVSRWYGMYLSQGGNYAATLSALQGLVA
jgi:hypothetical protein